MGDNDNSYNLYMVGRRVPEEQIEFVDLVTYRINKDIFLEPEYELAIKDIYGQHCLDPWGFSLENALIAKRLLNLYRGKNETVYCTGTIAPGPKFEIVQLGVPVYNSFYDFVRDENYEDK